MRRLTEAERQEVCSAYAGGQSGSSLATRFGVTDTAIYATLRRFGAARRGPSEARRQFALSEEAFDVVTPESAYWLGFLMADGAIHAAAKESAVSLVLSRRDREHVEAFLRFMGDDGRQITDTDSNNASGVKLRSKRLVSVLESYGVTARKSLTARALRGLDGSAHFWRGVVDGDGSFGVSKNSPYLSQAGSGALIEQFRRFVAKYVDADYVTRSHEVGNIYVCNLFGRVAVAYLKLLYAPGQEVVALPRKHEAALRICARFEGKKWRNYTGKHRRKSGKVS